MKPDQHKKKKNALYKKNHGITASSGSKDQKNKVTEKDTTNNHAKEADKKKRVSSVKDRTAAAGKTSDDSGSSGDERQFQRRKLVSNWNRYDDLPSEDEDDIPLQRGEDFNKLLSQAGGAAAHFRFKDEEMWTGETDTGETTVNVLSLNLQDIASSLNCIPLHERLTISPKLFSEQMLGEMTAEAEMSRSQYNQTRQDSVCVVVQTKQSQDTSDGLHTTHSVRDEEHRTLNASAHSKQTVSQTAGQNINSQANMPDSDVQYISAEVKSLEDDLDMLLSTDSVASKSEQQTVPISKQNKQSAKQNVPTPSDSPVKNDKEKKDEKKEENLEDWLDSMLDD